jgi:hypothetical protein
VAKDGNASTGLGYKAYTTPELVERWWSGKRGTVTSAEIDLRVGGAWRYVMLASGGFEDMIIDSGMEGGMQEAMDLLEQVAVSLR